MRISVRAMNFAAVKYADIFIPAGGRPYTVNDEKLGKISGC